MRFEKGDGSQCWRGVFETAFNAWGEAVDSQIIKPQNPNVRESGKSGQITAAGCLRLELWRPSLPHQTVSKFDSDSNRTELDIGLTQISSTTRGIRRPCNLDTTSPRGGGWSISSSRKQGYGGGVGGDDAPGAGPSGRYGGHLSMRN